MIIQELVAIQERHGFLPAEELRALSQRRSVPLHRIHEVASFYPLFKLKPPPVVEVLVCRDMSCHLRGGARLRRGLEALANELDPKQVVVEGVSCLGRCDFAPSAVSINEHVYWGLPEEEIHKHVRRAAAREHLPHQHGDRTPPGWKIDVYEGNPRYDAVRRFIEKRDGDAMLKSIETANLRGMGGAGFPTARKWSAVRAAAGDVKYVVCNADECEPGTFKDRELLRRTPHLIIEGMILAGLITGATKGTLYIRHEYHDELDAFREALKKAHEAGVCGTNILGSELTFALDVFVSPGGYVQGEESALLEAMEDRRGEPRNKPPFPVTHGLFNKPTVINNVETLAWVPGIILKGGEWYRDQGINGAPGMRFVSISGDVQKPGVYEVPFGQTVRDLIWHTAGGMSEGQKLKAIATSGPSGGFLPAVLPRELLPAKFAAEKVPAGAAGLDILDLTLDLKTLGDMGSMLGAAFVVYGDKADMVEQALNCVEFYRNESCGKCVPCRVGSQKLAEMLKDMLAGRGKREQLACVSDLAQTMTITSICGLGQVASNPMATVMKFFAKDLEKYLR
jgi:NADH:ubiquinone oxidoreductase subunit F (NADH-binding)/NADH:ubiquinone oxidoreductase subunit E